MNSEESNLKMCRVFYCNWTVINCQILCTFKIEYLQFSWNNSRDVDTSCNYSKHFRTLWKCKHFNLLRSARKFNEVFVISRCVLFPRFFPSSLLQRENNLKQHLVGTRTFPYSRCTIAPFSLRGSGNEDLNVVTRSSNFTDNFSCSSHVLYNY